jgi:DNA primase
MPKITQKIIDEILAATDIVDLISQYTPLRKAGKNFMGRCPFHQEKTPSFSVSQENGVYHCFGCGKGGNVFTFLRDIENLSYYEALKFLAERSHIKIEFDDEPYDKDRTIIDTLHEINKKAARFFYDNLMSREGEYAREYLNTRGIKEETITKFGLGYSPRGGEILFKTLSEEFKKEDIISSGLVIELAMNEVRDRFRGRLMFPIINEASKVVGFGGRKLFDEGYEEAKYINSSESKVYNKSRVLYGLNFARNKIKEAGFAMLVEGYMDLIQLYQSGVQNVVASSGTSLTTLQVRILSRYTNEIVVVYDSDNAGQAAARRAIELIFENNLIVTLAVLPRGEDPDSYIKNYGLENFINLIEKRQSIIDFIADKYKLENRLATPEGKTEFVKEIISLISRLRDEIKREFYIKDISERFGIYESTIRKELYNYQRLKNKGLTREYPVKTSADTAAGEPHPIENRVVVSNLELMLIRLIVDGDKKTRGYLMDNIGIDYLQSPVVMKIVNYLFMNIENESKLKQSSLFNAFDDDVSKDILGKAFLDESYVMLDESKGDFERKAKFVVTKLHISALENQINELNRKIKSVHTDSPEILKLQNDLQQLVSERVKLEKSLKGI